MRPLPATPSDAVAEVVREKVILGERVFLIDKPGGSDDLINHPAFRGGEYLPYWADLWPAARMLAKAVLAEPSFSFLPASCPLPPKGGGKKTRLPQLTRSVNH